MFQRMVNPRRVLMVLASARKALNPQGHAIVRNLCPQIRQARILPQVFPPRNYCSVAEAEAEAEAEVQETNHVLNILKEKEWCNETVEKLEGISDISEDDIIAALKTLNPDKALSFFEWYKKHPSHKPSSSVYNAMLRAVGRRNYFHKFWELAEEMKEEGFRVEKYTFMLFCTRCLGDDSTEEIAKLFTWMIENGKEKFSPNNCSRALFFLATNKVPNIHTAYRVIEEYKSCGGSMNKSIYDSLHRCLSKAGKFEEAWKVMDTMAKEGFTPNNNTYGQLVFWLCAARKLEEACKVIDEMKLKGCNADLKTWTVLIEGHANADETDRALALFSDMVQSGCKADCKVLQALVFHLCKKERGMDAYNLVRKAIVELKIQPSHPTYVELFRELIRSGMVKESSGIFDLMKEYNHAPGRYYHIITCEIIHFLGKWGTVEDASSFLSKINKDGVSGKRCISMVHAFCNNNRHKEAQELVSTFPVEVAKNPTMRNLLKECPNESTSQDGKVTKKAKRIRKGKVSREGKSSKEATNGDSIKMDSSE